jgi:hypothetical protein
LYRQLWFPAKLKIERDNMKIEIYDPALSCSVGDCGPNVDPELFKFYDVLRQIQKQAPEVSIERYGLNTDPQAFEMNSRVAELLKSEGPGCLPLGFVNGDLVSKGSYPDNELLRSRLQSDGFTVVLGEKRKCQAGCC